MSCAKALEQTGCVQYAGRVERPSELEPRVREHVASVTNRDVGRDLYPGPPRTDIGLFPEKDGEP